MGTSVALNKFDFFSHDSSPLNFVRPVGGAHLALGNVLGVASFECFIASRAIRRSLYTLLTKTNQFNFSAFACQNGVTCGFAAQILGQILGTNRPNSGAAVNAYARKARAAGDTRLIRYA